MVDLIGDAESPYALINQNARRISTIVPDVTLEEVHRDEMVITDHPVEVGSTISDHAFKRPAEVIMRIGFSDSKHQSVGFVKTAYANLLQIQANRQPFELSTGKRLYKDMLIQNIAVTTDVHAEFALSAVVSIRQVIITSTNGIVTQGNGSDQSGLASSGANMSAPQETQPVVDSGTQQLAPINSAGSTVFGSFLPGGGQLQGFPALEGSNSIGSSPFFGRA